jgi:hypothetical protein
MKGNVRKSFVLIVLVVSVMLVFAGVAATQGSETTGRSADKGWSALDRVPEFMDRLKDAGFSLHEGEVEYIDLVKECCRGNVPDTLANNPWPNAYLVLSNLTPEGYPPPPVQWMWQLREDEAIVLVGQTPPAVAYFSYQTFMAFPAYGEGTLPSVGVEPRMGIAVGDTTNIATVRTMGPNPFSRPIVYIITGHRGTGQRVRAAARAAGYPNATINMEAISPVIASLGLGPGEGSIFYTAQRNAVAKDPAALEAYIKDPPYRVFRVTPDVPLAPDPEPVPVLRVRGTGHTEMELYPALKRLRQAILEEYGGPHKELDTHVWWLLDREIMLEKPYVGLQRGLFLMGGSRDTNYLATYPNFKLRTGEDEFVIVYGVNHQASGKATYSSLSLYADSVLWFGVGTRTSNQFGDSARRYLPDDPDADMLYAFKVARDCQGEAYCMEVDMDLEDIDGVPYDCPDLEDGDEMFFIFRSYMEPATKVAPDDNELLYDQAIYFGAYFTGQ